MPRSPTLLIHALPMAALTPYPSLTPQFAIHGRHEMAWAGRVLCVKLWGSFNLEGVQSLIKGLLSQVETPPARWATCYDLEEWEGVTPDAVELFLVALGNALQIGWSAHAVVARSAAKVHLFSLQIERFMQGRIPYAIFATQPEALTWLDQQLESP